MQSLNEESEGEEGEAEQSEIEEDELEDETSSEEGKREVRGFDGNITKRSGSVGSKTDRLAYEHSSATSYSKDLASEKKQSEKKAEKTRNRSSKGSIETSPDLKINLKKVKIGDDEGSKEKGNTVSNRPLLRKKTTKLKFDSGRAGELGVKTIKHKKSKKESGL